MYCPECFQNTAMLRPSGVIRIKFNNKAKDSSLFVYNLTESDEELIEKLKEKTEEFFKWYANFQNIETIVRFEMFTYDITCSNKCKYDKFTGQFNVIGELLPVKIIKSIVEEAAKKFNIPTQLVFKNN